MYYKTFALYLGVINYTLSNHYNLFSAQRHLSLKKVSLRKVNEWSIEHEVIGEESCLNSNNLCI